LKKEFVEEILKVKQKNYDGMVMQYKTETTMSVGSGEQRKWISWSQICAKEGENNVRVMITADTICTRAHPKIPAGLVPWPENLQFRYEDMAMCRTLFSTVARGGLHFSEKSDPPSPPFPLFTLKTSFPILRKEDIESDFTTAEKGFHIEDKEDVDGETGEAAMALVGQMFAASPRVVKPSGAAVRGVSSPTTPAPPDRVGKAISALRRIHGEWDRKKREYNGCLRRSETTDATAGTHFEHSLRGFLLECDKHDQQLLDIEVSYTTHTSLTEDQLKDVKVVSERLVDVMKQAQKYSNALKSWFSVESPSTPKPKAEQ
jgi:hypothetical protein